MEEDQTSACCGLSCIRLINGYPGGGMVNCRMRPKSEKEATKAVVNAEAEASSDGDAANALVVSGPERKHHKVMLLP